MVKRWAFPVTFVAATLFASAMYYSGWWEKSGVLRVLCSVLLFAILAWGAMRLGNSPTPRKRRDPLSGLCMRVIVWDVPEEHGEIREATARSLEDFFAADGADVRAHNDPHALVCELEVCDVALEHRAGSVSLTGGRDSPQDRYSVIMRLASPHAGASGTRAVCVDVPPSASAADIGKRLAYEAVSRLVVVRSAENAPQLRWDDRPRAAWKKRLRSAR